MYLLLRIFPQDITFSIPSAAWRRNFVAQALRDLRAIFRKVTKCCIILEEKASRFDNYTNGNSNVGQVYFVEYRYLQFGWYILVFMHCRTISINNFKVLWYRNIFGYRKYMTYIFFSSQMDDILSGYQRTKIFSGPRKGQKCLSLKKKKKKKKRAKMDTITHVTTWTRVKGLVWAVFHQELGRPNWNFR